MAENLSSLIEKLEWLKARIEKQQSNSKASSSISKELGGILNYLSELTTFAQIKEVNILSAIPGVWKSLIHNYLGSNSGEKIYNFSDSPGKSDSSNFMSFKELANIGTQGKSDLVQQNIQLQKELKSLTNLHRESIEEKNYYQS
jgi:hypothetical protein